ncbi:hypothetical protein GCM10011375_27520 [Hymenobacter qilianensis]|uniref:Uncharacterized protein n=1 Tax=Hymenobacter qilianensis TaxID=1385715 RepID=A0ACB5PTN6_9BACT|nr:hypothetical protein GCM10011375_27520 [Hymenobacter qilianensis]
MKINSFIPFQYNNNNKYKGKIKLYLPIIDYFSVRSLKNQFKGKIGEFYRYGNYKTYHDRIYIKCLYFNHNNKKIHIEPEKIVVLKISYNDIINNSYTEYFNVTAGFGERMIKRDYESILNKSNEQFSNRIIRVEDISFEDLLTIAQDSINNIRNN